MRLDPVSLQLFVAVVEQGSIAAAAEREHIAAAAISRRIAELEKALGSPLLLRQARGVEPTSAGAALVTLARRALAVLDEVPLQLCGFASGLRGQVRMFANISAITQFLPQDLASFALTHPGVRILLEESNSTATVRAVADNAADVGICTAYAHGEAVLSLPYRSDRLCVVLPQAHRLARRKSVAFAHVVDEAFVGLRTGSAINLRLAGEAAQLGRSLLFRIQVTGFDAVCLMVAGGFGIGVVPEGAARLFATSLPIRAVRLTDAWAHRELCLVVRSLDALPSAARRLVEHLQAAARA
ncbi:LysR substrate-binding domain-containing protein [Ramlibacter sp.]|uniref:LysR substrate-binding domain-containing protein n=1 Tax=Ramlibacter sp. TaxID=1917967 RepID=UPI002C018250|nr:LysR substrate-binding domain-containing protein [Ramlibacter sp.]HWI83307.1 LysR substrate-binding domain-containing protein [Ramlibacter sp.]